MRARRGAVLGWVLVGLYAAAMVAVMVTTSDGELRPGDRERGPGRGRGVRRRVGAVAGRPPSSAPGTFERRSETTGAAITSEDVLAQRPPQRLHRQLGGVDGRDDRRMIVCPAAPDGGDDGADCALGDPAGPTYDEDVAAEVASLRSLRRGRDPGVRGRARPATAASRWRSNATSPARRSASTRASASTSATGAPTDSRVRYAGGIVEVLAVTSLTGDGERRRPRAVRWTGARGDGGHGMSRHLGSRSDAVGGSRNPRPVSRADQRGR